MSATSPIRIVIIASGGGSNASVMCDYFLDKPHAEVVGLVTNNPESGVFDLGQNVGLPVCLLSRTQARDGAWLVRQFQGWKADLLVLAGYIRLIPTEVVHAFPNRIINIHPALLPRHGGKGMWGMNVHQSVIDQGDTTSGITIHYVNEHYDEGAPIFQQALSIDPTWTASDLQKAVLKLEHHWFPRVVDDICQQIQSQDPKSHTS